MEQFRPIYGNPYSFGQGQAQPLLSIFEHLTTYGGIKDDSVV